MNPKLEQWDCEHTPGFFLYSLPPLQHSRYPSEIPTLTNPLSIARCPTTPFSSDTSSLEWASDSTSRGFSPTTPPPLQMPNTGSESPDYLQLLSKVAIYGRSPCPPLSRLDHLLAQLIKLRETCLSLYYILKDTIKGPARRDREDKAGRALSAGTSVPMELRCITLSAYRCVHRTLYFGILFRGFIM